MTTCLPVGDVELVDGVELELDFLPGFHRRLELGAVPGRRERAQGVAPRPTGQPGCDSCKGFVGFSSGLSDEMVRLPVSTSVGWQAPAT